MTQFEAATAAAFVALAAAGVDAAVIEAGLGGRLDATNTIPSQVTVLTSIGLDHTEWLGDTEAEIAAEKLAVLRDQTTLVLGGSEPRGRRAGRADRRRARGGAARRRRGPRRRIGAARPGAFQRRNFALACARRRGVPRRARRRDRVAAVAAERRQSRPARAGRGATRRPRSTPPTTPTAPRRSPRRCPSSPPAGPCSPAWRCSPTRTPPAMSRPGARARPAPSAPSSPIRAAAMRAAGRRGPLAGKRPERRPGGGRGELEQSRASSAPALPRSPRSDRALGTGADGAGRALLRPARDLPSQVTAWTRERRLRTALDDGSRRRRRRGRDPRLLRRSATSSVRLFL